MGKTPNSTFNKKIFLKNLTSKPGVYCMLDADNHIIYVGKAKQLKNRVSSYFAKNHADVKTSSMVEQIADIQVTITNNENEALILENTLIKKYRPRYNILFRDDKSYPYLYLSMHEKFPQLIFIRGKPHKEGQYFGPYPNTLAARETLHFLQKMFQLRQCTNHFFNHRTRPCLQYQIKRCSAPCVNYITEEDYQQHAQHAMLFLQGKNKKVMSELLEKMDLASKNMQYEQAALYRDQINTLRKVLTQQTVSNCGEDNVDVIAVVQEGGLTCVEIMFIRNGRLLGNRGYFPKIPDMASKEQIIDEFIPQYYLDSPHQQDMPNSIVTEIEFSDMQWISEVLSDQTGQKVKITTDTQGPRKSWLDLAVKNAQQALALRLADKMNIHERFNALQNALKLETTLQRIECFDISHTQGEATVASCVVFDNTGPVNSAYRRFNVKDITGGDDYAAMYQALKRRYTRLQQQDEFMPDLLILDGGKGQLHQAEKVLEELQVTDVLLLAIAKGPTRKPGLETLFLSGRDQPIHLPSDSQALHLLQHIRDEAHRFAITAHRQRRAKSRQQSILQDIPGVGQKRRQTVLRYFGGMQGLQQATIADICQVPGISKSLAELIYQMLHEN